MQKKIKELLSAVSLVFCLLLTVTFFLAIHAQEKPKAQKEADKVCEQVEQEQDARQPVSKSIIASIFLDKVTVKAVDWKLKKASHTMSGGVENKETTYLSFGKEAEKVHISILEFNSENEALEHSKTARSGGFSRKTNTYGDEDEKIFISGNFVLLNFRKGNVFVTVGGTDEKTAERFASYVAESIDNPTSK